MTSLLQISVYVGDGFAALMPCEMWGIDIRWPTRTMSESRRRCGSYVTMCLLGSRHEKQRGSVVGRSGRVCV